MHRISFACLVWLALAIPARADLQATVDLLDPSDGGPQPPAGVLVIDILVEVDPGDSWLASAIAASTVGGSTLLYGDADPNSPLVNPGADDPFVTCLSAPLPRFGAARFNAGRVAITASECPLQVDPIAEPTRVGTIWYDANLGSCRERPTANGAIARLAVALDPAVECGGDVGCCFALYPNGELPDGAIPILEANCDDRDGSSPPIGIAWSTCFNPSLFFQSWILARTPTAGSCRYDLNRDRTIDVEDLAVVLSAFGATEGQTEFNPQVDFDDNSRVDLQDLAIFLAHYGAF